MGVDDLGRVEVTSRAQWRAWLADNHDRAPGIWLVTYKKHCGDRYLPMGDLVREAICFGWIDSRSRRIDDDRQMVLVTRRKPGSAWSAANKRLVAELQEQGLIAPAGQAVLDAARADPERTARFLVNAPGDPDLERCVRMQVAIYDEVVTRALAKLAV